MHYVYVLTQSVLLSCCLGPSLSGTIDQDTRDFGLNGESNLDLQYSMPFVHPLNVELLYLFLSLFSGADF